ncbi:MAG: dephospho-CoA kinase [Holophagaceae bacterium]|nr:dephospho-CoA kinase [Holophagaceae bacterium]
MGLSGGIAAGKSFVASWMRDRGWAVIDADALAREVVAPGSEGLLAVAEAFGPSCLLMAGLDRPWMAAHVFSDEGARARLNALLHPRIEAHLEARLGAFPSDTQELSWTRPSGWERGRPTTSTRSGPWMRRKDLRLARLMDRDGLTRDAALARLPGPGHRLRAGPAC